MYKQFLELLTNKNEKYIGIGNDERIIVINISDKLNTISFEDTWEFFLWLHDYMYFEDVDELENNLQCSKEFLENMIDYIEHIGIRDLTPEQLMLYGVFKYKYTKKEWME